MAKKTWKPTINLPGTCLIPIVDLDKTGTQVRVANDEETIAAYADAIKNGEAMPPVDVVWDGENPILAEGFHRTEATLRAGFDSIQANVREGTRRDAILIALERNQKNGLRMSAEDKRKAVGLLLDDEEWGSWSDREISRKVGCSNTFVGIVRKDRTQTLSTVDSVEERKFKAPSGKTSVMKTEKIGKKPASKPSDITSEKKPAKELPPDQESKFDKVGQEVPAHLEEAFALCERFSPILDTISEIKSECKDVSGLSGGEVLNARMTQIQSQTSEIYRAVAEAEPFAICMSCKGDLKKATTSCKSCKGLGWITRQAFERFPESVREAVPKPVKVRK